ncbi:MAG TPA: hypothetical protein VJX74_02045 [Blastocatellia bacterium]|nr:hypothetical protein [Blastocatellia bacterium]
MITGIPNYTGALPIEYSLRCSCARRYVVFTGMGVQIGDAMGRAKERATEMKARFIDARSTPFMNCECGELLEFLPDERLMVM